MPSKINTAGPFEISSRFSFDAELLTSPHPAIDVSFKDRNLLLTEFSMSPQMTGPLAGFTSLGEQLTCKSPQITSDNIYIILFLIT